MKAITVEVFRSNLLTGCSNNGISEKFDRLLVLCENGPDEVEGNEPNLCRVEKRVIGDRAVYAIKPVANPGAWYMAGGSFAYTSDSRFNKLVGGQYGAISIHDRRE